MTDFDLDNKMAEDGYVPGVPIWGLMEDYDNDAKLCAGGTCQICRYKDLGLRTFIDWSALVYTAFTECPHCGNVEQL